MVVDTSTGKETHSLKYLYTATSGVPNFPAFVTVLLVDEQPASYYDSIIRREIPRQDWMKDAADPDYWNSNTQICIGAEQIFMNNIDVAKQRFNQTGGIHVNQQMYGCEWDDVTEATKAFQQEGYDGEDFISLDLENMRYIAPVPQALLTKQKYERNKAMMENDKHYYTQTCVEWLKKYVQYGSSTLGRKVRPEVSLLQKVSAMVCYATGFYPDGVMITWKRDGEEMQENVDVGETLPNEDGTFQKRVVLTVSDQDLKEHQYTCEVAHQSGETIILDETEIKRSNPNSVPLGPIIGVAVALIVLIAIVAGFVVMKNKKKDGFTGVKTEEGSQTSSERA